MLPEFLGSTGLYWGFDFRRRVLYLRPLGPSACFPHPVPLVVKTVIEFPTIYVAMAGADCERFRTLVTDLSCSVEGGGLDAGLVGSRFPSVVQVRSRHRSCLIASQRGRPRWEDFETIKKKKGSYGSHLDLIWKRSNLSFLRWWYSSYKKNKDSTEFSLNSSKIG